MTAPSPVATKLRTPRPSLPLDRLALHQPARVHCVDALAASQPAERVQQLIDIGFVPGERVAVVAAAWPGGDPLVVRVGHSRFALRRAEAACVQVEALE
jgi:ferrous iron transport protein A